jgi:subtilisin-like proprotein convertase family protein
MSLPRPLTLMSVSFLIVLALGCPKTEYWSHDVVPIPDYDLENWAVSAIDVPRSFTITDVNVTVNVTHPDLGDCDAWVESAEGEVLPLIFIVTGANLANTTFNDEAAATIDTGSAPYTGHWKVDSFYVNAGMFLADGENAKGIWTLNFRDQQQDNVGEITSWGLKFNSGY